MKRILLLVICLVGMNACTPRAAEKPIQLSSVRPPPEGRLETVVPLLRSKVVEVLDTNRTINYIRLVQVFSRESDPARNFPQYRMFEIREGSIGQLLQLESGDILVAANDYVVFNPQTFQSYLELFRSEKDPYIEIIRRGRPMVLRYHFIE